MAGGDGKLVLALGNLEFLGSLAAEPGKEDHDAHVRLTEEMAAFFVSEHPLFAATDSPTGTACP